MGVAREHTHAECSMTLAHFCRNPAGAPTPGAAVAEAMWAASERSNFETSATVRMDSAIVLKRVLARAPPTLSETEAALVEAAPPTVGMVVGLGWMVGADGAEEEEEEEEETEGEGEGEEEEEEEEEGG